MCTQNLTRRSPAVMAVIKGIIMGMACTYSQKQVNNNDDNDSTTTTTTTTTTTNHTTNNNDTTTTTTDNYTILIMTIIITYSQKQAISQILVLTSIVYHE